MFQSARWALRVTLIVFLLQNRGRFAEGFDPAALAPQLSQLNPRVVRTILLIAAFIASCIIVGHVPGAFSYNTFR